MTQQRTPYIVQLSAAAVSTGTIPLDYRFAPQQIRSIAGSIAAGDTLTVLVSPVPVNGEKASFVNTTLANQVDFFVTVSTYSNSFSDIINGPWAAVKAVKTGSAGTCTFAILG